VRNFVAASRLCANEIFSAWIVVSSFVLIGTAFVSGGGKKPQRV